MPIYCVRGGEQNPDYHGGSRMPILGYFEGEYQEVLEFATTLDGWTCYGEGKLEEIFIQRITPELTQEVKDLYQRYTNAKFIKQSAEVDLKKISEEMTKKGLKKP